MRGLLVDALTQTQYYGELAALSNEIKAHTGGIDIHVNGPYQHLLDFFFKLLTQSFDKSVLQGNEIKFSTYRERYMRTLKSKANMQPYELALTRLQKLCYCVCYTFEELLEVFS